MDTLNCLIMTLQSLIQKQTPVLMPHALPYLTLDYLNSVGRLNVKNNLADLLCDFRRINQDWINFIEYGNDNAEILHDPKHSEHQRARAIGTSLMGIIFHKCEASFKLVEDTLVLVRIYTRTDKSFFRFRQPFVWPCEMLVDIEEERKKLVSERQSNQ
ncbi:MAG: hypothetical protein Q7T03_11210 [Deltaproteobacteria bacterium]|nr:hypothetical protein [Deltaproteobacteria bacterium]